MPVNTPHRLSQAAFWYSALPAVVLAFIAVIAGAFMRDLVLSACMESQCPAFMPYVVPGIVITFIVAALAQPVLTFILFSYSLTNTAITINSGIIFRQYETIDFTRIQTIDLERGPLLWLFGLTEVRLWTASADQFNQNEHTRAEPDTTLYLDRETAEQLRDHISAARSPKPQQEIMQPSPQTKPATEPVARPADQPVPTA